MYIIKKYVARDGKEFNNPEECSKHEATLGHNYEVQLNFIGTFTAMVSASSKEEAIDLAKIKWYPELVDWDIDDVYVWQDGQPI